MNIAYLGLGSNLNQPLEQLRAAVAAVDSLATTAVMRMSRIYRSAAVGPGQQPDYLNAALKLSTALQALELLDALQKIELQQGRVRTVRWGPRTLDLDILLYDDRQFDHPRLQIPHPALSQRNFVLYPLADLANEKMLLPNGAELGTLLAQCPRGDLEITDLCCWRNEPLA